MRFFPIFSVVLCLGLAACANRSFTPTVPDALEVGTAKTIFAATSRQQEEDGTFGFGRSEDVSLLELTVSIPPSHTPGHLDFAYANPDPKRQFTMADRYQFQSAAEFQTRLRKEIAQSKNASREATVFIHGFNSTQSETTFRAAQMAHDMQLPGPQLVYSWPSRGSPLGYAYDGDSILFARDGLEQLLRQIRQAGASRTIVVAHSMGTVLLMETLRQIEIADPGWARQSLGGVILISPDLDVDLFRSQMSRLKNPPKPFIVFVSRKDKILDISSRIRGTYSRERLGNISSLDRIADLPIEVIDTTEFSKDAGSAHFVPATSPSLIAMMSDARAIAASYGEHNITAEDLFPGSVVQYRGATEIDLKPALLHPR
ncbi:MAG: alpha/beta fold hydrolase [Rhodobacteraceae bacterium]|nr:alpha/beta fold hydrolase [Paracoccaceae bacterium]